MVKSAYGGVMKNDPMPPYGKTEPFRFVRFEQLPSRYGVNGSYSGKISSGCAPSNPTDNNYHSGVPFLWSAEASRDGARGQYVTSYMDVTIKDFERWNASDTSQFILGQGSGADGSNPPDRTFGHVLRLAKGSKMPHQVNILDQNTVTGPGSWSRIVAQAIQTEATSTEPGMTLYPTNNRIIDTSVHGVVILGEGTTNTEIRNVDFRGHTARTILNVADGVTVDMQNICALAGSLIEGAAWSVTMG
jgi:hypothetical protein